MGWKRLFLAALVAAVARKQDAVETEIHLDEPVARGCCIGQGEIEVVGCCIGRDEPEAAVYRIDLDEPVGVGCRIPLGPEAAGCRTGQDEKRGGYPHSRPRHPGRPSEGHEAETQVVQWGSKDALEGAGKSAVGPNIVLLVVALQRCAMTCLGGFRFPQFPLQHNGPQYQIRAVGRVRRQASRVVGENHAGRES
jgi:hypothetical protein